MTVQVGRSERHLLLLLPREKKSANFQLMQNPSIYISTSREIHLGSFYLYRGRHAVGLIILYNLDCRHLLFGQEDANIDALCLTGAEIEK